MNRVLEVAIEAARAGGDVALHYFRSDLVVEQKADASPVTVADREAEKKIVEVLRAAFPEHGILGEESGEHQGAGARWIVDPIDGTKSFIRGIPFFATLVALEEEGEITTGAVFAPATGDLLYARKGMGAFDENGPLHVSSVDSLRDSMLVFGGANVLREKGFWDGYVRLVDASCRQRAYGDYFGYTFVARGQAEGMIEVGVCPWDLAAVKVVIEEAGGRFTDHRGVSSVYGGTAVASNGKIHSPLLAKLNGDESR